MSAEQEEMRAALQKIAALVHHGGLIGFAEFHKCLNEVRKTSLPWWDSRECSRLQKEE